MSSIGEKYKKVFSSSRFRAATSTRLRADTRDKRLSLGARADGPEKAAFLGKIIESGRTENLLDFGTFCDVSFPHVIGIFGSRGSGKSFDLGVLVEGIFLSGGRDAGVVFDVQDQFWTLGFAPDPGIDADAAHLSALEEWGLAPSALPNVKVWCPGIVDTPVPDAQEFTLSSSQLALSDWIAMLGLEQFSAMGQALGTLIAHFGSMTPRQLSERCFSGAELSAFQQSTIDGLRWRLQSLDTTGVIAAEGVSVDDLLRPGTLSVILMRNLTDQVRGLVVGVVSRLAADRMSKVQQSRKVASRTGGRVSSEDGLTNRLWIVLDEAHVLAPSDGETAATAPLIDYVKRGRDAGLSLIFATQQPSAVDTKLMSQVDMTINHRLGFENDISAAINRMPTRNSIDYEIDSVKTSSIADVIRSLGPGEAVIADGAASRIFVMKVRPRVTAHGGATPQ